MAFLIRYVHSCNNKIYLYGNEGDILNYQYHGWPLRRGFVQNNVFMQALPPPPPQEA